MHETLRDLVDASMDMIEQVSMFIDLDDRVEDPAEHDLADVTPVHCSTDEFDELYDDGANGPGDD